eukprot:scaffold71789_cov53-Phaeocystis_antarctica.AAC.1
MLAQSAWPICWSRAHTCPQKGTSGLLRASPTSTAPVSRDENGAMPRYANTASPATCYIGVLYYLDQCAPSPVVPRPGDGSYSSTGLPDVYISTRNHLF